MSETTPSKTSTNLSRLAVWDNDKITVTRTRDIKRLTFRNLMSEIGEAFNLNRGLIYTIKNLTIRPAQTIKAYLDTERDLVMSPFKYFFFIVGITLFIASLNGYFDMMDEQFFKNSFEAGYGKEVTDQKVVDIQNQLTEYISNIIQNYYIKYQNFWYALTMLFTSWLSWLFFKKSGYNFIEHLAINTFTFSHTYLLYFLMVIFKFNDGYSTSIYMIIYMGYSIFVFKRLFGQSTGKTILKGITAYLLSMLIYMLLLGIIMGALSLKFMSDNPIN